MHLWLGLRTTPRWGAITLPKPLAGFKEATSLRKERKEGLVKLRNEKEEKISYSS